MTNLEEKVKSINKSHTDYLPLFFDDNNEPFSFLSISIHHAENDESENDSHLNFKRRIKIKEDAREKYDHME